MKYLDAKADIKSQTPHAFRKATIFILLLILLIVLSFADIHLKPVKNIEYQVAIQVEDIPQTKQEIKKEESRPKIGAPIEAEKEEISDTITIAETDLKTNDYVPPPPPPQESEILDFFAVEKQPQIISQAKPTYPELARKAGQEGAVMVEVVINTNGIVDTAYVIQSRPKGVFEDAAIQAAYKWKFSPAYQRDKPVKVRMQIPFRFTLSE